MMLNKSKTFRITTVLWAIASMMPYGAQAQTATQTQWTLQQCIDYAMDNNLELRQKRVSIEQSDVDIEVRKEAMFPTLSASTNQNVSWRPWSESYVNITDGSMASTTSTVNYNGTYGLQTQWTIWNGGVNSKQLERSRLQRTQAVTDEEVSQLSIQEQIVQLYSQILYQTEAVNVCKEILASTQTQLVRAQAMYDVGSMSRADLAQVEAQVSQEEYNVANVKTQLSDFKKQLRQLLQLPADEEFGVVTPSIDDARVMDLLPTVADVYGAALTLRPELKYSQLSIDAAELDIDIARRGRYPTVSLQGGINTSASSGLDFSWLRQLKTNLSNQVGLTISVPILDGKQTKTNVARAKLDRENAEIALQQQQRALYNDIETFWLNATNAQQQYKYALTNVKSMQESYDLVSEQFEVGLKDVVALTTAKNNLVQAQQQLLQSKYTAVLNRALLNFYQGQELTLN